MTVTDTAPAPAARGPGFRERLSGNTSAQIALRWLLVLVATVVAFWPTLGALVIEMRAQTAITYLPAVVLLVVIAAIGTSWRRGEELPIRDRQTDVIVGIVVLLVSLTFTVMSLRYATSYLTTHVDLLALWLFLLGSCILVFGLRPVARYKWPWLLLLMIFPVPYRVEVLLLGGGPWAAGGVMIAFGAVASGVATGRTLRRGLLGAAITTTVGVIVLVSLRNFHPSAPGWVYQTLPCVGAALVASAWLYVDYRRRHKDSWTPLGRDMIPVSVPRVGRPAWVIVVFAVGMFFIPIPSFGTTENTEVPGLNTRPPLVVPSNWVAGDVNEYDWITRLYGRGSIMTTQDLFQAKGSLAFDKFARPRKVVVNAIETRYPLRFDVYPFTFVYDLVGDRISESQPVALPHGVTGHLQTVVDDQSYLTFNRIFWQWNNGTRTQRVTVISVDNHDADAEFPRPEMTVARNLNTFVTVLFRGNSVTVDLEPQFKDRELLVQTAGDLINAQVDAIAEDDAR